MNLELLLYEYNPFIYVGVISNATNKSKSLLDLQTRGCYVVNDQMGDWHSYPFTG